MRGQILVLLANFNAAFEAVEPPAEGAVVSDDEIAVAAAMELDPIRTIGLSARMLDAALPTLLR
jgi:hypothetical protein